MSFQGEEFQLTCAAWLFTNQCLCFWVYVLRAQTNTTQLLDQPQQYITLQGGKVGEEWKAVMGQGHGERCKKKESGEREWGQDRWREIKGRFMVHMASHPIRVSDKNFQCLRPFKMLDVRDKVCDTLAGTNCVAFTSSDTCRLDYKMALRKREWERWEGKRVWHQNWGGEWVRKGKIWRRKK